MLDFGYVGKSQISAPEFNGQFPSLSYTPSDGHTRPDKAAKPVSADKIRADMRLLAPLYARDPNLFRDRWRAAAGERRA